MTEQSLMERRSIDVRTLCAGALAAGVLCGAPLLAVAAHSTHAHRGHGGAKPHAVAQFVRGHVGAHTAAYTGAESGSRSAVDRAVQASAAAGFSGAGSTEQLPDREYMPGTTPFADRPWIEGYAPLREDELFHETYRALPSHNVLKVYVADAGEYG